MHSAYDVRPAVLERVYDAFWEDVDSLGDELGMLSPTSSTPEQLIPPIFPYPARSMTAAAIGIWTASKKSWIAFGYI